MYIQDDINICSFWFCITFILVSLSLYLYIQDDWGWYLSMFDFRWFMSDSITRRSVSPLEWNGSIHNSGLQSIHTVHGVWNNQTILSAVFQIKSKYRYNHFLYIVCSNCFIQSRFTSIIWYLIHTVILFFQTNRNLVAFYTLSLVQYQRWWLLLQHTLYKFCSLVLG